jgi:RHS repeat-associated protein
VNYNYNSDNTLQYKVDAKGQAMAYTYDSQKRVTMTQQFPSGMGGAEDTCRRVTYTWDTNALNPSFSSNATGRLTTAQYADCLSNYAVSPATLSTSYVEMYSYHPAGGVVAKRLQVNRVVAGPTNVSGNLEVDYTFDAAGRVVNTTVPFLTSGYSTNEPTIVYYTGYDLMGRPNSLSDNDALEAANGYSTQWVQNVAYDYAGRRTSLQRYLTTDGLGDEEYTTETMSYNVNGQLASLNWSGWGGNGVNGSMAYTYSATQNNGQITQVTDTVSGETISYEYGGLKRLILAVATPVGGGAPAWTQAYGYDGFGNLTAKVLNGTSTPIAVSAGSNRLTNSSYDSNGNMLTGVGATLTYDETNRMVSATPTSGGTEYYAYAPDNKRIYRLEASGTTELWTLYGARGEKVGVYSLTLSASTFVYTQTERDVWFGGKLIWNGSPGLVMSGQAVQDRLGTNRAGGAQFYPYGDEISSTANDRVKFATYNRDSFTTLDYADQRYYASLYGRFNTPDPFWGSAKLRNPGSWNRYSYTGGDPVNRNDRRGLDDVCGPDAWWDGEGCTEGEYDESGVFGSSVVFSTDVNICGPGEVWQGNGCDVPAEVNQEFISGMESGTAGFDTGFLYFAGGSAGLAVAGLLAPVAVEAAGSAIPQLPSWLPTYRRQRLKIEEGVSAFCEAAISPV